MKTTTIFPLHMIRSWRQMLYALGERYDEKMNHELEIQHQADLQRQQDEEQEDGR